MTTLKNGALRFTFITAALLMFLFAGCTGTDRLGSVIGGTVLSVSQVDITNDPTIPFEKEIIANVLLDGGGNYIYAASSPQVTATSKDGSTKSNPYTVGFQMSGYSCPYQISNSIHTISALAVKSYLPPNSNNFFSGNPWSASCRVGAAVNSLFSNRIYASSRVGTDAFNNPVYCNAMPTPVCEGDFRNLCNNQAGYRAVPCTIPRSQSDATLQSIFGSNPFSGYACVKVEDHDPATADYQVREATAMQPKFTATMTVTPQSGAAETITLNDQNAYSGHSQDVYVKSTANLGSNQNPPCPSDQSVVWMQNYRGSSGAVSKSEYTRMLSMYSTAKQTAQGAPNLDVLLANVNDYNSQIATSTLDDIDYSFEHFQTASGGELRVDRTQNPPNLPWLVLYLNAQWVGIVNPIAIPQLTCPSTVSFTSGDTGTGTFTVRNAGTSGGALSVGLPTCQPGAAVTWVNNPNRNYNSGEYYSASFHVTGDPGTYSCSIQVQSSGPVLNNDYHQTACAFSMQVAQACTNSASPPRYRSPTPEDPCRVVCPLDPAIAGSDICAESGLVYNASSCTCAAKPDCAATNSCPRKATCDDGTAIGICNGDGKRCKLVSNDPVLEVDSTCTGDGGGKQRECIPLLEEEYTEASGGITIPFLNWNFGGATTSHCRPNLFVWLFGGCLAVIVIAAALAAVFIIFRKKKR